MVAPPMSEAFDSSISKWVGYALSNGGKQRSENAFRHLRPHLPEHVSVLSVGGVRWQGIYLWRVSVASLRH